METSITNLSLSEIDRIIEIENQSEIERLIPLFVYLVVISVTGIIGNGLVCHSYYPMCNTSSSRCLIFFLGVVDLLLCVTVVPIEIATTFQQFNFTNEIWCQVTAFVNLWTFNSLGYIFVIVAIDRYRKVCTPYGWQMTTFKVKVVCGVLVGVAGAFSVPVGHIYNIYKLRLPNSEIFGSECSFRKEENGLSFKAIYIGIGMLVFVGSLFTICILYCRIGVVIMKHTKKERTNCYHRSTLPDEPSHHSTTNMDDTSVTTVTVKRETSENSDTNVTKNIHDESMRVKRARKATFSMFLISLAFVICYLPILSLTLMKSLVSDLHEKMSDEWRAVYKFFLRSGFLPCAINPFIYGCCDSKFRQSCHVMGSALRRLFYSTYCCKHRESVT